MKEQSWIFSVRYYEKQPSGPLPTIDRWAVVGPARASTVEAALHLAKMPEELRAEVRADEIVRDFIDGRLDPDKSGYITQCAPTSRLSWCVCIGSVHEVLDR